VVVFRETPVCVSVTVTVALGIVAPEESVIVPMSVALTACANAMGANAAARINAANLNLFMITFTPTAQILGCNERLCQGEPRPKRVVLEKPCRPRDQGRNRTGRRQIDRGSRGRTCEAVERISGAWVKGAYYETLGREPITGRLLRAADDRPAAISAVFAVASAATVVTSESALGPALLQHSHDVQVARSTRLG